MTQPSHVFAAIRWRRSVRTYSPRPIEQWKLDLVLEAARLAPSSTNSQPWRIIVVRDLAAKQVLAGATPGGLRRHPWMVNAPAILILCAEKSKTQRFCGQVVGKDYHLVDVGIAGEHICLAATELGLGTCWVGWIHKRLIKKTFHIPALWDVVCLVTLGYPAQNPGAEVPPASAEPRQQAGEVGIGDVPARERYPPKKIIFFEKVE